MSGRRIVPARSKRVCVTLEPSEVQMAADLCDLFRENEQEMLARALRAYHEQCKGLMKRERREAGR